MSLSTLYIKFVTTSVILHHLIMKKNSLCYKLKGSCPPDTYYDDITKSCDSCGHICVHAEKKDSTEDCKIKCPDYRPPDADDSSNNTDATKELTTGEIIMVCGIVGAAFVIFVVLFICCMVKSRLNNRQNTADAAGSNLEEVEDSDSDSPVRPSRQQDHEQHNQQNMEAVDINDDSDIPMRHTCQPEQQYSQLAVSGRPVKH